LRAPYREGVGVTTALRMPDGMSSKERTKCGLC
jgi:hypothetical protein